MPTGIYQHKPHQGFQIGHIDYVPKTGRLRQSEKTTGNKNWRWIFDRTKVIGYWLERNNPEYKQWRMAVFKKDGYKCFWCGDNKKIRADHILMWSKYPEKRYDINNGQTLCDFCHKVKTLSEIKGETILKFNY